MRAVRARRVLTAPRPLVLRLARAAEDGVTREAGRPRKRARAASPAQSDADDDDEIMVVPGPSTARPGPARTSSPSSASSTPTPLSPRKLRPSTQAQLRPARKAKTPAPAPASSDVEEMAGPAEDDPLRLVACPLECGARVRLARVNQHIDAGCPPADRAAVKQKAQWAGLMGGGKGKAKARWVL
jgi:hypothetical protein